MKKKKVNISLAIVIIFVGILVSISIYSFGIKVGKPNFEYVMMSGSTDASGGSGGSGGSGYTCDGGGYLSYANAFNSKENVITCIQKQNGIVISTHKPKCTNNPATLNGKPATATTLSGYYCDGKKCQPMRYYPSRYSFFNFFPCYNINKICNYYTTSDGKLGAYCAIPSDIGKKIGDPSNSPPE